MKKPDFFIVGAPKCGTSSMTYYLNQHPDVYLSNPSEPLFFCPDIISPKVKNIEEYLQLFEGHEDNTCGEKSTRYLFSEIAPRQIYDFNSDAKIIIMLRDPVSFIYSWHSELLMWFVEDRDNLASALQLESDRKKGFHIPSTCHAPKQLLYRELASFSIYAERYLSVFGKDNVKFILLNDLKKDPLKTYQELLNFINVDSSFIPDFEIKNRNKVIKNMQIHRFFRTPPVFVKQIAKLILPDKNLRGRLLKSSVKTIEKINIERRPRPENDDLLKKELISYFMADIKKLEQLIDRDLKAWIEL